jgi:hypothetical protein
MRLEQALGITPTRRVRGEAEVLNTADLMSKDSEPQSASRCWASPYAPNMSWQVSRDDGTLVADVAALEHDEWKLLLASVDAELARAATVQVIIHAGTRPPDSEREALVEALSTIVRGQGVKVRVAYQ